MTLIGRKAWHTCGGILLHGTVIEHRFDPDIAILLCDNGTRETVSPHSLHLSIDDAIRACDDAVDYWQRTMESLEVVRDEVELAICKSWIGLVGRLSTYLEQENLLENYASPKPIADGGGIQVTLVSQVGFGAGFNAILAT